MNRYNKLVKIFPYIENINDLQIDEESFLFITNKDVANNISDIIIKNLKCDPNLLIITDATAGVGGNTLSFAKKFKNVNAIEISESRYKYLCNNLNIYNIKNVNTYNCNCLDILTDLNHDIIFIDPPWGGKIYKNFTKLKLTLSDMQIEDIINDLFTKSLDTLKAIVLKMPKNYDLEYFNNIVKYQKKIICLDKMLIILVYNN